MKFEQYLDIIDREVDAVDIVIRVMLEMASSDEPVRTSFDMSCLVREVFDRMDAIATRQLQLASSTEPFLTDAEQVQMRQVITNLVTNALQASSDSDVILELQRHEHQILITVQETDPVPADRDRLFEPLFTTKAKGTGLGLSIYRQIIEHTTEPSSYKTTTALARVFVCDCHHRVYVALRCSDARCEVECTCNSNPIYDLRLSLDPTVFQIGRVIFP